MKIGILTLPLHTNYGGILQAYALQTVLERMGHEVEVLNTRPSFAKPVYWKYPLRLVKKLFVDNDTVVDREARARKEEPVLAAELYRFQSEYIHSRFISGLHEIREGDYEAIVVGSDQIWRPKYFKHMWKSDVADAFLAFTKGWELKRISYAPSFGVDDWELTDEETGRCRIMMTQFDGISVREFSGMNLCKEYLHAESVHVLDPTLLLCRTDYVALFERHKVRESKGDMLCYILDDTPEKRGLISRISRERRLVPFSVNCGDVKNTAPISDRIKPSIEEWLQGFQDAEFVVTDSFHACVFSIIFHKPFVVIGNVSRGMSRFHSLLSLFNLEKNLLTDVSQYDPDDTYTIYPEAIQEIRRLQDISMNFLLKSLS